MLDDQVIISSRDYIKASYHKMLLKLCINIYLKCLLQVKFKFVEKSMNLNDYTKDQRYVKFRV